MTQSTRTMTDFDLWCDECGRFGAVASDYPKDKPAKALPKAIAAARDHVRKTGHKVVGTIVYGIVIDEEEKERA